MLKHPLHNMLLCEMGLSVSVDDKKESSGRFNPVNHKTFSFHLSSASICLYYTGQIDCLLS